MVAPAITASAPLPGKARDCVATAESIPRASAAPQMAWPSGWLAPFSTPAARARRSASFPTSVCTSVTRGLPWVSVPVLSKATWVTRAAASITAPPFISNPLRAPVDRAEVIDAGTEITSAQGQPISSKASAR